MGDKTKEGITVTFKEQPDSVAGILTAYIKNHEGEVGTEQEQSNLVDRILDSTGISRDVWRVVRIKLTPNSWGVTMKDTKSRKTKVLQAANYQLKVEIYLERIVPQIDSKQLIRELAEGIPALILPTERRRSVVQKGVAAEIAVYDTHFGKLAWKDETGYRHYDTKLAAEDYAYVVDRCLDLVAPHRPEKIIFVVGQDLFHIDNMASHTTGGEHTLDVDGRITKIYKTVFENTRNAILLANKIAPVEVIWVPGNHDFLASYMLTCSLKEHFRQTKGVTFDVNENPRKARLWGNLLVGWTHSITGKHTVWSNELAQAFPDLWGQSTFREWHHGDQHKKQDVKITPLFTSGGVICRQITALSPVDQWHTTNVFTDAVPGGEAFLWSKDIGVFANFTAWTGQYETHRNKIVK